MKVYVHYDSSGAIHDLIAVDAPEIASAMLAPQPGLFVAEVEGKDPWFEARTRQVGPGDTAQEPADPASRHTDSALQARHQP